MLKLFVAWKKSLQTRKIQLQAKSRRWQKSGKWRKIMYEVGFAVAADERGRGTLHVLGCLVQNGVLLHHRLKVPRSHHSPMTSPLKFPRTIQGIIGVAHHTRSTSNIIFCMGLKQAFRCCFQFVLQLICLCLTAMYIYSIATSATIILFLLN